VNVTDLSFSSSDLTSLRLSISTLAKLRISPARLRFLAVKDTEIAEMKMCSEEDPNFYPCSQFKQLWAVDVRDNALTSVSWAASLPSLQTLYLAGEQYRKKDVWLADFLAAIHSEHAAAK